MKRIAWLTVLLTLALLLTACATPADPEQTDTTAPTTTTTTSAVAGDSTTDTTAEGGSTTEGEAPATTDGEEPAEPTAAPTTEQGKPTTSKTEGTKPTTKPTTTEPTGNEIDWGDLFGDTTTKKDGTTTTTTKKTTTAPTKTTQKPQVVDKVTLPAVGTDVDGRGRIYLSAASLKNGVVTLTLHNYTDEQGSKWQTEETNYVTYACYDAAGNQLTGKGDNFGTFYIGALQAGEEVSTTFPLPEGTVKVELTGSKIVYWTPWS